MNNEITATETAAVAEQGATNTPETTKATKKASPKKGAPKAKKGAKEPKNKNAKKAKGAPKGSSTKEKPASKKAAKAAGVPREFSKKAIVLDLLRRKDGATLAEIAKATDWQNHSIRGFLSGQVSKKMGLTVESTKNEKGERRYKIAAK
jgi:hypothetical protein